MSEQELELMENLAVYAGKVIGPADWDDHVSLAHLVLTTGAGPEGARRVAMELNGGQGSPWLREQILRAAERDVAVRAARILAARGRAASGIPQDAAGGAVRDLTSKVANEATGGTTTYTYTVSVTVPAGNEAGDVAGTMANALGYTVESANPEWSIGPFMLQAGVDQGPDTGLEAVHPVAASFPAATRVTAEANKQHISAPGRRAAAGATSAARGARPRGPQ